MRVTTESLAASFQRYFAANLSQLIPGGLHQGKPPGDTEMPYAIVTVKRTGHEGLGGPCYLETFSVTIETRTQEGQTRRGPIEQALDGLNWATSLVVCLGSKILHVRPITADVTDEGMQAALDVRLTVNAWEVLIQQTY